MKTIILLGLILGLSACTISPTGTLPGSNQRYETHSDRMNAWVGASEKDLFANWGKPDAVQEITVDSRAVYYQWYNRLTERTCISKFIIDQGKVSQWGHKGCPIRTNKEDYKLIPKSTPIPQATIVLEDI